MQVAILQMTWFWSTGSLRNMSLYVCFILEDAIAYVAIVSPQWVAYRLSWSVTTLQIENLGRYTAEVGAYIVSPVADAVVMTYLHFETGVANLSGILHRSTYTQGIRDRKLQEDVAGFLMEIVEAEGQLVAQEGSVDTDVILAGLLPGQVSVGHGAGDGDTWIQGVAEAVVVAILVGGLVRIVRAYGVLVTQETP